MDAYACVCAAGWEGEDCAAAAAPAGFAVFAVGNNDHGQLGDGSTTERHALVAVSLPGDAVSICAGSYHAGIITLSGAVFMFGWNNWYQLGDGTTTDRHTPVEVTALGADNAQLAAGFGFTVARKVGGGVWSWGYNRYGQIGDGTTTTRQSPYHIASLGDDNAFVAARYGGNIVMKSDGRVFGWGYNVNHQITAENESDQLTPVAIAAAGTDNIALATGYAHALMIKLDGSLVSWGTGTSGQLGNGGTSSQACCVTVSLTLAVTQIAAGDFSSYALLADGSVYAWGSNDHGQLGDGTTTQRTSPVRVSNLPRNPSYQLGGGGQNDHTFVAMLPDGSAVGSGKNDHGKLAKCDTADVLTAGPLPGLGVGTVATAGGWGFMLLLKRP
eukprot:COSAG06_NODE_926_length_11497_cov_60.540216_2_plen_385_part_00